MKKKEKRMIAILLVIMVIAIVILMFMRKKPEEETKKPQLENNVTQEQEEKFVEKLEDGTKLNTSNKLKETKKIEGLEIKNIQLTEKDDVTLLLATVKNVTNMPQGGYQVGVTILDENEKELITIDGYIEEIEPNGEVQFSTSGTFKYANAYDIKIAKK